MEKTVEINQKASKKMRKTGRKGPVAQTIFHIYLWSTVFLVLLPLAMTILFSLKGLKDFDRGFWALPAVPMFSNYSYGFFKVIPNMLNSIAVCLACSFLVVLLGSYVAYLFARRDFYGKNLLFMLIIALMMVPGVLTMTPRYILMQELGLRNTWWSLILPWVSSTQVGAIFMLRTFMGGHPKELYESVKIDGGGDFSQYFYIAVPLSIPIVIIQFINTFTSTYNDYAWSLLMIDVQEMQLLMPVLKTLIFEATQTTGNPGITYAMYLISGIPLAITTAVGMKFFINGDFASGLKL